MLSIPVYRYILDSLVYRCVLYFYSAPFLREELTATFTCFHSIQIPVPNAVNTVNKMLKQGKLILKANKNTPKSPPIQNQSEEAKKIAF